ncbi:MAG: hypothetical protein EB059_10480 [Alphaproteobacteria bacterium]|nr:hypothetical protein [Alphaproteobacteria bacterium]
MRLISVSVMLPSFLAILLFAGWPFHLFMLVSYSWTIYEWRVMLNRQEKKWVSAAMHIALALVWAVAIYVNIPFAVIVCLSLSLVLMLAFRLAKIERPVLLSMGISFLGSTMLAFIHLREWAGFSLSVSICAIVWVTDVAAFFTGKMLRGAKLAPDISPSKTWTGFIGGLCFAAVMAYGCAWLFNAQKPWVVVGMGLGLSLAAHCGDLFESWVKRRAGVKDSGILIPGHGGLLDRVDGLIMAMVLCAIALWAVDFDLSWWVKE